MHLPVKVLLEQVSAVCQGCGVSSDACRRINLFTKVALAETPALCPTCFGGAPEMEWSLALEEPEVAVGHRKGLKKQRKVSREQEIEIADELGAKVQPASGAMSSAKGDVRKKGVLRLEAKFTTAKTFPLVREELDKIAGECINGEKPVFVVDYQDTLTHRLRGRYAVIPFDDLKDLLDAADHHRRPK